ncbi:MAG: PleD family two-component system response regulator [Chitinophagaceae bacterium]
MPYSKILLVDDNKDLLMITQIILKGQGYETFLASSIQEAERKIKIHQPQLLLLDVCIGDEDGRDFCRQIKSNPDTNAIQVILMSGDDLAAEKNCPGDDFLSKPFDFNELITKVHQQVAYA